MIYLKEEHKSVLPTRIIASHPIKKPKGCPV
jgi:hypothetical protein